jgi:hypothetical protein
VSCAGLTKGHGGEGARITSSISFGGWSYPDALGAGTAGDEVGFDKDEFVCAATSTDIQEATSVPTKIRLQAFWIGISTLRFNFRQNGKKDFLGVATVTLESAFRGLPVPVILGCVFEISQLMGTVMPTRLLETYAVFLARMFLTTGNLALFAFAQCRLNNAAMPRSLKWAKSQNFVWLEVYSHGLPAGDSLREMKRKYEARPQLPNLSKIGLRIALRASRIRLDGETERY